MRPGGEGPKKSREVPRWYERLKETGGFMDALDEMTDEEQKD